MKLGSISNRAHGPICRISADNLALLGLHFYMLTFGVKFSMMHCDSHSKLLDASHFAENSEDSAIFLDTSSGPLFPGHSRLIKTHFYGDDSFWSFPILLNKTFYFHN
jgi:hypothetical protein